MGVVYKTRQVKANRIVALKIIRAYHTLSTTQRFPFGASGCRRRPRYVPGISMP